MKSKIRHLAAPSILALGFALAVAAAPVVAQSSVVTVPPPIVQDYWVSISRQPNGILVFDGYAPSDAARNNFAQTPSADVSFLKLGSGAPASYDAAVAFGLSALERMSEGRFALRDDVVTISGIAATQADFLGLTGPQAPKPPSGFILAKSEVTAPLEKNYTFSVRKQGNGSVVASGFVPQPSFEQRVLAAVGPRSSSTLRFASGEPVNFERAVDEALSLLDLLQTGEVKLENGSWLISGTPKSAAEANAIRTSFSDDRMAEGGWSLALSDPAPQAPAFNWRLEKNDTGAITMTGAVPTEAFKRVVALRLGNQLQDKASIADNAPDGFITEALAAADALTLLNAGTVSYEIGKWSIVGEGDSSEADQQITQALAAFDGWAIEVSAPAVSSVAMQDSDAPADQPVPADAEASTPTATAEPIPAIPEVEVATSVAPTTPPVSNADDIAACSASLSQLSAQNGILFKSGAAVLAEGTDVILQAMATAANQCPSAALDVAGHTDSDGVASANLALSVSRAEAVINALIALGVDPSRLYAIGYGDAQPVADNDTQAGKAQNRRIVVSVRQPQ
ncbi:OmpA family protein [Devosia sp. Leaf64]|uniref:OmpA family protein n=1 Tax=Devosia sp. Leaf64 TaxID=1736229 RepID=UPI0007145C39|nr:OmpA family protein [Devosia sp. Leaf64]KQN72542.1 hypothetical protein ASE94_08545 [Devosia sp. Leaf64]